MGWLADGLAFCRATVRIAYEEEIRYPAAALAYYAFVSFVPLLLLVFVVVGDRLAAELSRTAPQFLTPQVQRLVDRSLQTAAGRTGAGLFAALVLVWSSLNLIGDIRTVVGRIEDAGSDTLSDKVWDTLAILLSLGLAILATVATTLLFPFSGPLVALVGFVGLWVILVAAFVPLYYAPSELVASPADALPGAATAAFGWGLIHAVIQFYAANAGQYAIYGVLSGIIVILTSLYGAALVLLVGFIINELTIVGAAARSTR